MTEPVGKKHAAQTQKQWTASLRDPDRGGGLVAYVCDILQDYAAGNIELGAALQTEVSRRCKRLKLEPLRVWNNLVALAHALPKREPDNLKG